MTGVEKQTHILTARAACVEVLASVLRRQAELQIEFATKSREIPSFVGAGMEIVSHEHRDMKNAMQSIMALQHWMADMMLKSGNTLLEVSQELRHSRCNVRDTIRAVSGKEKTLKKDHGSEMKAMEKLFVNCQKLSEQAVFAHWAVVDVDAHHTPESVECLPRLQKVADTRFKEVRDADTRYCESVRVARTGVLRRRRDRRCLISTLIDADRLRISSCLSSMSKWLVTLNEFSSQVIERVSAVQDVVNEVNITAIDNSVEDDTLTRDDDGVPEYIQVPAMAIVPHVSSQIRCTSETNTPSSTNSAAQTIEAETFWDYALQAIIDPSKIDQSKVPFPTAKPGTDSTKQASAKSLRTPPLKSHRPPLQNDRCNRRAELGQQRSSAALPKTALPPSAEELSLPSCNESGAPTPGQAGCDPGETAHRRVEPLDLRSRCLMSLETTVGRHVFANALDRRRMSMKPNTLSTPAFNALGELMNLLLTGAQRDLEGKPVMQILSAASSLHLRDSAQTPLLTLIQKHPIWQGVSVWVAAFTSAEPEQCQRWYCQEECEDLRMRNSANAFSLLMLMSRNMAVLDVGIELTLDFVSRMATLAGLEADKVELLIRAVHHEFGEECPESSTFSSPAQETSEKSSTKERFSFKGLLRRKCSR